uniref:Uncharacterized protein n=1 Tax=Pundamilia nyererei TaxID=303518 RepID=A0A3B4EZ59_9CICH
QGSMCSCHKGKSHKTTITALRKHGGGSIMILGCFLLLGLDALQILREKLNFKLYQGKISVQKKKRKEDAISH